jgi:hypothetical protein
LDGRQLTFPGHLALRQLQPIAPDFGIETLLFQEAAAQIMAVRSSRTPHIQPRRKHGTAAKTKRMSPRCYDGRWSARTVGSGLSSKGDDSQSVRVFIATVPKATTRTGFHFLLTIAKRRCT